MTGTIVSLTREGGFGYIRPDDYALDDARELVFFHKRDVIGTEATYASMTVGDVVTYDFPETLDCAHVTEWQPSGAVAQTLRRCADDIERALANLNMFAVMDGNRRHFDNFQHAKVHQHLRYMPAKLRREADALTTKEMHAQTDAAFKTCAHSYCTEPARAGHDTCAGHAPENFEHGRIADLID